MVKIFDRVVVDFVLLEEAVEFIAGGDAQERAELVSGDAPLPVGFEAEGLQSGAGRLLSGRQQGRRQIVGKGDRDLHGYSLAHVAIHNVPCPQVGDANATGIPLPRIALVVLGELSVQLKVEVVTMPKVEDAASLIAKQGEKMIEIKLRFWTNNLSPEEGKVIPKHAWTSGVVRIEPNKSHGIDPQSPRPFHTLLDVGSVIEKVLIEHGVVLHSSRKMRKYFSGKVERGITP